MMSRPWAASAFTASSANEPIECPHRLGEESRSDHRREQDLGFPIGRRAVRPAGLRHVIQKLRVQGFRPVPVGLAPKCPLYFHAMRYSALINWYTSIRCAS